jgi:importin subunit beta-1
MSTQNSSINIDQLLQMALEIDETKRNNGMNSLNNLADSNLSLFLQQLGTILSDESKPTGIRQLSAVLIKNTLVKVERYQEIWKTQLPQEEKNRIKLLVLSTLASSKREIRTIASTVISSISKVDSPITQTWPDLLPSLTQNAFNQDINMKLSAIEALGYVCEEITIKSIDASNVDNIMNALIQNLKNEQNSVEVVLQVLKALYYSIRLAEKNFSNKNERAIIMDSIFQIGTKYETNENVLDKIAMLFIEMLSISSYYDYIEDFFEKIIKFSFNIVQKYKVSNERLALLGLEIICCIGDEEVSRNNNGYISLARINQGFTLEKVNKGYLSKISNDLQKLIVSNVSVADDDEDESEWTISKACLNILNLMAQTAQPQAMAKFYKELSAQIEATNNNLNERAKCWLLLGSLITPVNKQDIAKIISYNFNLMFNDIKQNDSVKLKKCASFLIYKITKIMPKIFDQSKLGGVIDVLSSEIKNCKESIIVVYLCQSLQNIIKINGDLETNKSSCGVSNYFEKIFKNIFIDAKNDIREIIEGKSNNKTSFTRLMTIGTLIEYSSHDKQTQIYEVIKHFLFQIESTQNDIENLVKVGASKETIFQIQEFYFTLLQKLFNKYKSQIDLNFAQKIWQLTETLFKYRQTVFDEANLALAALARNMKENFKQIFILYYPYIEFSIKSYSNNSLSKTGLLSLLHCITSTQDTIQKSEDMMKILIDVCTSNEVSRNNKTIAINIIGELALFSGVNFRGYLDDVMKLLFSAAQMGLNIAADADEDIVDFVKTLRYELIQTFTCIELTFNDNENNKYLNPYIQSMFAFLKSCVEDTNIQTIDILRSILNLIIDLFGIYGIQFKQLCDENFVAGFIKIFQEYSKNKGKLDPDIEQNIDILKSYYINKN